MPSLRLVLSSVFFASVPAFANALPVQYSMTPNTGFAVMAACSDENGVETKSEIRLRLSSSRLEPVKTVGLTIGAKVCVRFMGLIQRVISFKAFPIVAILTTPLNQNRLVPLSLEDLLILQKQIGEPLKPAMLVHRELSYESRSIYRMSLLKLNGEVAGSLSLEMSDEEARKIPGYDYQTQVPIVAFRATFDGVSLSSYTRATATVGLSRAPIAMPAATRRCTLWERITSYFRGPNPNCQ